MGKLNEQIRLWNSICICTATTNRITGKDSFHWPSLLLTMLRVLPWVFLHSSLIKDITQHYRTPRARSNLSKGQRICSKPRRLTPGIMDSDIRGPKMLSRTRGLRWSAAPDFKIGDFACVKATFLCTTRPSKKLSEKNLKPFEIIAQVAWLSFTLRLPEQLRAVHPMFHVSQLEPATRNIIPNWVQPHPPPIEVNDDIEFEISEILDSKIDKRRKCQLLYLVRWTGYEGTDQETDWLSALELTHTKELVQDFHNSYPHKPGPLSSLTT